MKQRRPGMGTIGAALRLPLAVALLLGAAGVLAPAPAAAQTPTIVDTTVDTSDFPRTLTFSALVDDGDALESAVLFYRVPPEGAITRQPADVGAGDVIRLEAVVPTNTARTYIPPGATIEWWWALTTDDGETTETARREYSYEDPRYDWKVIADDVLELYYYENEGAARALHQVGRDGIAHMSHVLGAELDFPARVYLWSNSEDAIGVERVESSRFEQLIFTGGTRVLADLVHVFSPQPWIVVHELTHILTKQAGEGIAELPAWLDEGVATYSEGDWRARRGLALQRALEDDRILSVRSIGSNTNTPGDVDLFYGQSADIVEALIDEFGDERFADLFAVFKRGSTVDAALMEVYGFDREGLDAFYRTQRGLEARGETADRSTRIEDEQIGPAGAESQAAQSQAAAPEPAAPERADEAEEAQAEPAPVAAAEADDPAEEAREVQVDGRRQAVEAWNGRVRLGPTFGPGAGFPWAEALTGAGGGALLLSLAALFVVLGRGGVAAPATAVPPAPPAPPPPAGDGSNWGGWRRRGDGSPADDDPAPDASAPDASAPDASAPDASAPDASTPDESAPDKPEDD